MSKLHSKMALTVLGLAAIALAGCEEDPGATLPRQSTDPWSLQVQRQSESHEIVLDTRGAISALERQRLDAFIADLSAGRPEALRVTIGGARNQAQNRVVARILAEDGLDPKHIAEVPGAPARANALVITVDRYTVVPPPCAPWTTLATAASDNSVTRPDFGCSNLKNLGAMVADPHDLVKGSSSVYADGAAAAAAVKRYQEDKVKPLPPLNGFGAVENTSPASAGAQ